MSVVAYLLGLYLAADLGISGLSKLLRRQTFAYTLRTQNIWPKSWIIPMTFGVPLIEVIVATLLVSGWLLSLVSWLVVAVFVGFAGLKVYLFLSHSEASCGCSGNESLDQADVPGVMAGVIVLAIAGTHLFLALRFGVQFEVARIVSVALITALALSALALFWYRTKHSSDVTVAPPPEVGGLRPGTVAPSLVGVNQWGQQTLLDDLRGRRVLLAFVSPGCTPCSHTMAVLKRWLQDAAQTDGIYAYIVGQGDQDKNAAYAETYRLMAPLVTPVDPAAHERYDVKGFPTVFALDERGVIQGRGLVISVEHLQGLLQSYPPLSLSV